MKLSKKQINEIAAMWAAGILLGSGADSFIDEEIDQDGEIVNKVHKIGEILLGNSPYFTSLPDIIKYVKNKS